MIHSANYMLTKSSLQTAAAATPKRKYLSIHEAVRNGDIDEIISMVKAGASINEVEQENKFTPLHWAAHSGALEVFI